jgi:hypothetical protein
VVRKGSVWIGEDERREDDGWYLLGTFSGFHDTGGSRPRAEFEGMPIDAALAWARERADHVYVTTRGGRFSAGAAASSEYPSWPPDDLPPLVRRRPPGEEWLDRTRDDEPIAWVVEAWLGPADDTLPRREDWDGVVAALAARAGALSWDAEELDEALADMRRAQRRGAQGWYTYGFGAYRLRFQERAPTREQAIASVRSRCPAPAGGKLRFGARPL